MTKTHEKTDRKPSYKKKPRKPNPTPKKKKPVIVPVEKKKKEGYDEPFPVSIDDQVDRINSLMKTTFPSKTPKDMSDVCLVNDNFVLIANNSLEGLKKALKKSNIITLKSENAPYVKLLIITLSSERALELGQIIEPGLKLENHPVLLCSHGGGRKSDQIMRQTESILKKTTCVAIGTPGRVLRLLQDNALNFGLMAAEGALVIFDMEYDSKQRDVLGMIETKKDVAQLLEYGLSDALKVEGSELKVAFINNWSD